MNQDIENVKQAKASFDHILDNQKYASIIRDDTHLAVILDLVRDGKYRKILDIGTGTGYLAFPLAEKFPQASIYGIDIAETIMEKNNEIVKEKGDISEAVIDNLDCADITRLLNFLIS